MRAPAKIAGVTPPERRLAALLSADVAGYSRLMAEDETATIRTLSAYREAITGRVRLHHGRVVDAPGDNLLAEFPSALEAVESAVEIQRALERENAALPPERRMHFRIGVHLGDVAVEGERIYGDGVNIAARLEGLAEPGGIAISATVYEQVANKLELACTDLGPQTMRNIPRPVQVYRVELGKQRRLLRRRLPRAALWTGGVLGAVALALALSWPRPLGLALDLMGLTELPTHPPLPDLPSIVVLPFENLSGDPEQEYFSDGMTEDLTTALSSSHGLFVISRGSAFTYRDQPRDIQQIGRELGVRYVLEGSVRREAERVRITAQLIDAQTGFHLWSQRYDREVRDVFELQSEIAEEIWHALAIQIDAVETARARRKPTANLTAYDAVLRGLDYFKRTTRDDMLKARAFFERAAELDPEYADAWASLGSTYAVEYGFLWNLDARLLERAEALARRALELDPGVYSGYATLTMVSLYHDRTQEAIEYGRRAVELGPNIDAAHAVLAAALGVDHQNLEAIQEIQRAVRLNPRAPPSWVGMLMGIANIAADRDDQAREILERVRRSNSDLILPRIMLTILYVGAGRHEEAHAVVDEVLAVNPKLTAELAIKRVPWSGTTGLSQQDLIAQLRTAGLP